MAGKEDWHYNEKAARWDDRNAPRSKKIKLAIKDFFLGVIVPLLLFALLVLMLWGGGADNYLP